MPRPNEEGAQTGRRPAEGADGRLDFVDRVKYMMKSGDENIYPAEIERVPAEARVKDAIAVAARNDMAVATNDLPAPAVRRLQAASS